MLLLIATVRLLGRLPLRLLVFPHCFPLFLVCLLQHLLLLLGRLLGPARIFLRTDALSLNRYRPRQSQGNQQHKSGNAFHNVSERKILQRSYTEAAPGWHIRCYFCNPVSGGWEARPLPGFPSLRFSFRQNKYRLLDRLRLPRHAIHQESWFDWKLTADS